MNDLFSQLKKKINKSSFHYAIFIFIAVVASLAMIAYVYQIAQKSKAVGETVTLSFNPQSVTASSGQDFSSTIRAQPSVGINVRGYAFQLTFDKTKIQAKDIQYKLGNVSIGLGDDNSNLAQINASGVIKIQGEIQAGNGQTLSSASQTDVVALTFTSSSSDSSSVNIGAGTFYKINSDYSISPVPTNSAGDLSLNGGVYSSPTPPSGTPPAESPTPPPGATETPPPGTTVTPIPGAVTLNLKLKFQGILKKPPESYNSFNVKVTALPPGGGERAVSSTFSADEQGVWSGSVNLDIPAGSGYKIYVKGPKHIQKRICSNHPTETFPGSYHCEIGGVNLTSGVNNLDLSGIYQLVGDLPIQDGVVNSYDISLVRNNIGSREASVLALADLNLDGIVDSQDYSLVIAALSIRSDEGE